MTEKKKGSKSSVILGRLSQNIVQEHDGMLLKTCFFFVHVHDLIESPDLLNCKLSIFHIGFNMDFRTFSPSTSRYDVNGY